jgi:hypothetical protein
LKQLLPHPKAAIFVADYNGDYKSLINYLLCLTTNETAYEEHRAWRHNFSYEENIKYKPLLQKSLQCRICDWAARTLAENPSISAGRTSECEEPLRHAHKTLSDAYEGQLVRSSTKEIFLLQNGTIHHIPNMDTFRSLKFDLNNVLYIPESEFKKLRKGHPLPEVL